MAMAAQVVPDSKVSTVVMAELVAVARAVNRMLLKGVEATAEMAAMEVMVGMVAVVGVAAAAVI